MAFTFDPALGTNLDRVRLKIGDTVEASSIIADETITALLNDGGSVVTVAIELVRNIIASFARDVDKELGPLTLELSDRIKNYNMLLDDLIKERDVDGTPSVFAGGYTETVRDLYDDDDSIIKLPVDIGMHNNE